MSVEFFRTIVSPMGQRGEAPGAEPSEQPNDSRVRFAGGDGDDGPSTTPTSTARKASMGARLKDLRFQSQVGIALSLPSCPARLPRPLLTRATRSLVRRSTWTTSIKTTRSFVSCLGRWTTCSSRWVYLNSRLGGSSKSDTYNSLAHARSRSRSFARRPTTRARPRTTSSGTCSISAPR